MGGVRAQLVAWGINESSAEEYAALLENVR